MWEVVRLCTENRGCIIFIFKKWSWVLLVPGYLGHWPLASLVRTTQTEWSSDLKNTTVSASSMFEYRYLMLNCLYFYLILFIIEHSCRSLPAIHFCKLPKLNFWKRRRERMRHPFRFQPWYITKKTENVPEPIVLVILKSACFLIHALLPRDLKARGLKSARSADFIKFWLY
jgi:hypothetical protein